MTKDLTIEILREIRDGIGGLRDDFNARLDRVEHGLNDLGQSMRQIALDRAKHERFHAHHVARLEEDVGDLKDRMRRLEERASPIA